MQQALTVNEPHLALRVGLGHVLHLVLELLQDEALDVKRRCLVGCLLDVVHVCYACGHACNMHYMHQCLLLEMGTRVRTK